MGGFSGKNGKHGINGKVIDTQRFGVFRFLFRFSIPFSVPS